MLKLKLQYFDHLTQTADSLAKSLMLDRLRGERKEGIRGLDGWMALPMNGNELGQALGDVEGQ